MWHGYEPDLVCWELQKVFWDAAGGEFAESCKCNTNKPCRCIRLLFMGSVGYHFLIRQAVNHLYSVFGQSLFLLCD